MPRTRATTRRVSSRASSASFKELSERFEHQVKIRESNLRDFYEMKKKQLMESYTLMLVTFGPELLKKTVRQFREECAKQEEAAAPDIVCEQNRATHTDGSLSSQKDDGYVTDAVCVSAGATRSSSQRVSRSVSRTNYASSHAARGRTPSNLGPPSVKYGLKRSRSSSVGSSMRQSRSARPRYRTPANRVNATPQYPLITPKIVPDTPITVLRRPRQGEMVVSLSGSPLLVNSTATYQANCNIPLSDGTILSLLPNKMTKSAALNVPHDYMHPQTTRDLRTLEENLRIYLNMVTDKRPKNK
ncbi:uncharacterized protein LOC143910080 [Arctopsyche grandis]|uniref:uncharacterized protein LOC143910080 n=1 Tax=Arctopsyche grandis TaxID=121162 RepID=UPI00406D662C